MSTDTRYEFLYNWIDRVLNTEAGLEVPIRQSYSNIPAPAKGTRYIVINYAPSSDKVGRPSFLDPEQTGVREIINDYTMTLELREVNGDGDLLLMLIESMDRQEILDFWDTNDLVYLGNNGVFPLPRLEGHKWVKECIVEINMARAAKIVETSGVIEDVDYQGTIPGQGQEADHIIPPLPPYSMMYDYVDTYSEAEDSSIFNSMPGDLTFSFWIKIGFYPFNDIYIIQKYSGTAYFNLMLLEDHDRIYIRARQSTTTLFEINSAYSVILLNQWLHIGIKIDRDNSSNCKLFRNGVELGYTSRDVNPGSFSNTEKAVVGKLLNDSDKIILTQLAFWNNSLAADEDFALIYNNGHPLKELKNGIGTLPPPTYCWKFKEGQGNEIIDDIGGYRLNVNNSIWSTDYP